MDIQASLGALYKGRIAQLAERTHLVDSSIILGEVGGSIPPAATSTGEEGMPQGGAKQLRRLRCIVSLILYIHIIGVPEQSGTSGRLV